MRTIWVIFAEENFLEKAAKPVALFDNWAMAEEQMSRLQREGYDLVQVEEFTLNQTAEEREQHVKEYPAVGVGPENRLVWVGGSVVVKPDTTDYTYPTGPFPSL